MSGLVLFCGSRTWRHETPIRDELEDIPRSYVVMHGGAGGADNLSGRIAKEEGFKVTVVKADWDKHGKKAGFLRNIEMLDKKPSKVFAFWDGESRGTMHTVDEARKRKIPIVLWAPEIGTGYLCRKEY